MAEGVRTEVRARGVFGVLTPARRRQAEVALHDLGAGSVCIARTFVTLYIDPLETEARMSEVVHGRSRHTRFCWWC